MANVTKAYIQNAQCSLIPKWIYTDQNIEYVFIFKYIKTMIYNQIRADFSFYIKFCLLIRLFYLFDFDDGDEPAKRMRTKLVYVLASVVAHRPVHGREFREYICWVIRINIRSPLFFSIRVCVRAPYCAIWISMAHPIPLDATARSAHIFPINIFFCLLSFIIYHSNCVRWFFLAVGEHPSDASHL